MLKDNYPASIFSPQMKAICLLSFKSFLQHVQFRKLRNISWIFPGFSWGIFSGVTCLDQSHATKNIEWSINTYNIMPC